MISFTLPLHTPDDECILICQKAGTTPVPITSPALYCTIIHVHTYDDDVSISCCLLKIIILNLNKQLCIMHVYKAHVYVLYSFELNIPTVSYQLS